MFQTALVDGDILVYRIGASTNDLSPEFAVARMRTAVTEIGHTTADAGSIRGFISPTGSTFRHRLAVTKPYKGNRKDVQKPVHYNLLRRYLQQGLGFEMAADCEADDLLGINLVSCQEDAILVTLDKDLRNVPGYHCDFVKHTTERITQEEALINHARQVLTGDRTDNIPGLFWHCGVPYGKVKAEQDIPDGTPPDELWDRILHIYGSLCSSGEEAEKKALETAQLTWVSWFPGDLFHPSYYEERL